MKNSKDKISSRKTLNRGWAEIEAGKISAATTSFRQALTITPSSSEAWYGLGLALHDQRDFAEAQICYKQALHYNPKLSEAWNAIGDLELNQSNYPESISAYGKALSLEAETPATRRNLSQALNNYGNLKRQNGLPRQALDAYRQALTLDPDNANYLFNLGLAYDDLGDFKQAEKAYRKALEKDPKMSPAYGNLGNLLRETARLEKSPENFAEAETLYRQGLALNPENDLIRDNLMRLRYLDIFDKTTAVPTLTKELESFTSDFMKWRGHLLLAQLLDRNTLYEQAFTHAQQGHRIAAHNRTFCKSTLKHQIDHLISFFNPDFLAHAPRSNNYSQRPIFIIGMPRSGTTLTEQILAAHPDIEATGEKPYIGILADKLPAILATTQTFPECLTQIDSNQLTILANEEEERLREFSLEAQRITCKLPGNFFYLGLISLLFPQARIIHCQRRPADTIISIFLQNFVDPLSFSHQIEDLIFYYQEYRRLMAHWHRVIDLEIFTLNYEDLVLSQEQQSRQMLQFTDLKWNPECLDFHNQPRLVLTASRDQVKRPIYKSSLERWLNYAKPLAPWDKELKKLNEVSGY